MLKAKELNAIKILLIEGGANASKEEREEAANVLATLRAKYNCDNHKLHEMYSKQLRE